MKALSRFSALMLLALGVVACAAGGQEPPAADQNQPADGQERPAADQNQPAETVAAESVVDYDSDTNGALQVNSVRDNPTDWFDVLRDGERAFAGNPLLLNRTLELAPGTYDVDVNRTRRQVTIAAGKKTVLWTGELLVEGQPSGAYWYPMQGNERMLSSNPSLLDRSRPLFPGTYTVFVHVGVGTPDANLGDAEVTAGKTTVLRHAGG